MLTVEGVDVYYGDAQALEGVSLDVPRVHLETIHGSCRAPVRFSPLADAPHAS